MADKDTTVDELRELVRHFVNERDWRQFHSPKNLSMALAIEAAELMEHFQWLTPEASRPVVDDPHKLGNIGEELADVLCYALAIANELGIDVSTAHMALDAAVLNAYGFTPKKDLLAQLLKLNLQVSERIEADESVTAPGVPSWYPEVSRLVTEDCIR
jgi:NTP pyrophosphatase (non-canonical NTP hydrolase)